MHELSIVTSILDIAEKAMREQSQKYIEEIELEIGELAGVDMHAFDFAWKTATKNTILDGVTRKIHHKKGKALCLECNQEFDIKTVYDPCPKCHQYFNQMLTGQELRVISLITN